MRIFSRKTAKQTCRNSLGLVCGFRTETRQKILNSLAPVLHKNKRNVAGSSEKVVHPCPGVKLKVVYMNYVLTPR